VLLIVEGVSPQAAAAACGASRATGYRLWRRYLDGGELEVRELESANSHMAAAVKEPS